MGNRKEETCSWAECSSAHLVPAHPTSAVGPKWLWPAHLHPRPWHRHVGPPRPSSLLPHAMPGFCCNGLPRNTRHPWLVAMTLLPERGSWLAYPRGLDTPINVVPCAVVVPGRRDGATGSRICHCYGRRAWAAGWPCLGEAIGRWVEEKHPRHLQVWRCRRVIQISRCPSSSPWSRWESSLDLYFAQALVWGLLVYSPSSRLSLSPLGFKLGPLWRGTVIAGHGSAMGAAGATAFSCLG